MYNKILDFVESKLEGFERPEVKYDVEFKYGVDSRYIYVPIKDECSIEQKAWWKKFMIGYLEDEYDLYLSICDNYIFSFLHELGHYITLEGIEPQLINDNYNRALMKLDKIKDNTELETAYRQINIERMADLWATSFIEEYPEVLDIELESIF